jgi:uncharacterized membrane protein
VFESRLHAATPLGDIYLPPERLSAEDRARFLDVLSRAETSLVVGRPAAEIYAYLADLSHLPEWSHTCLSIDSIGSVSAGMELSAVELQDLHWDKPPRGSIADRQGLRYQSRLTITALESGQRIAWETHTEPMLFSARWLFRLEAVSDQITMVRLSTELTADEACRLALVAALQRWAYPLDVIQRQVDRAMHNLRTILEGRG